MPVDVDCNWSLSETLEVKDAKELDLNSLLLTFAPRGVPVLVVDWEELEVDRSDNNIGALSETAEENDSKDSAALMPLWFFDLLCTMEKEPEAEAAACQFSMSMSLTGGEKGEK